MLRCGFAVQPARPLHRGARLPAAASADSDSAAVVQAQLHAAAVQKRATGQTVEWGAAAMVELAAMAELAATGTVFCWT